MATHPSILPWEIPWTEEPARLQSMGPQRIRYDRVTEHARTTKNHCLCTLPLPPITNSVRMKDCISSLVLECDQKMCRLLCELTGCSPKLLGWSI